MIVIVPQGIVLRDSFGRDRAQWGSAPGGATESLSRNWRYRASILSPALDSTAHCGSDVVRGEKCSCTSFHPLPELTNTMVACCASSAGESRSSCR